jgi:hypothetical protein
MALKMDINVRYLLEVLVEEINSQIEEGNPLIFIDESVRVNLNESLKQLKIGQIKR